MLKIGSKAPAFTAVDQNGATVNLKDYLGKKVALYFYPKDDTPGCTAQACNLRDNIALLIKNNITVLGVSVDDVKKHKKFEDKYSLPFTLVADIDKTIVTSYKVWGEKMFMGRKYMGTNRVSFLINETGKIDAIIDKVETENHSAQILEAWGIQEPAVKGNTNTIAKKKAVAKKAPTKKSSTSKKAATAKPKATSKTALAKKDANKKPVPKKATTKGVATKSVATKGAPKPTVLIKKKLATKKK
jgi:thioredoxin-dependent peroxiredoxin